MGPKESERLTDQERADIWNEYTGREVAPGRFRVFCHRCGVPQTLDHAVSPRHDHRCDDCRVWSHSGNHGHRCGVNVHDEDANGIWGNLVTALEAD